MLKYFLALLFLAAVWTVVLLLPVLPIWIAIAVTGAVVLGFVVFALIRWIRARRAARAIERVLKEQAADQLSSVSPEQRAQLEAMHKEFERAVASIKHSKLGKRGFDALYELPWYMFIGPPGSGKTTALRNSGLHFPYLSDEGGVRGVGGTRNCDWWLSNEAVMLDTAGRYTSGAEDRDEWFGFLDLLRKHRPRKPINGVLLAISVAELGGMSSDEVAATAKRMRERIDEVMNRLEMVMPVYVVFTKCDLVPGFVETFGTLDKVERRAVWGATYSAEAARTPEESFRREFSLLVSRLWDRAMNAMYVERRADAAEAIYGFPQQLQVLEQNLSQFIGHVFSESVFQETPTLRGTYFTSGTQEGAPIDRAMASMAAAFGVQIQGRSFEKLEPKSYFLGDLLAKVVFADADLAARSESELRRQRRVRLITAASITATAGLVSALPAQAYVRNRRMVERAELAIAQLAEYERKVGTSGEARKTGHVPLQLFHIDPVLDLLVELDGLAKDTPLTYRFGMEQVVPLRDGLDELYADAIRTDVILPLLDAEAVQMNRLVECPPRALTSDQFRRYHGMLRRHLVLTTSEYPDTSDGHRLASREGFMTTAIKDEWLASEIVESWGRELDIPITRGDELRMSIHATRFLEIAKQDEQLLFVRDRELVGRVRDVLNRRPQVERFFDELVEWGAEAGYDITLRDIMGSVSPWITAKRRIRGAFTRNAWEKRVRDQLDAPDALHGEAWVLGLEQDEYDAELAGLRDELRARYFRMYVDEWREFLRSIEVTQPEEHRDVLVLLQELTRGGRTPYARLFRVVSYNSKLRPKPRPADEVKVDGLLESAGEVGSGLLASRASRVRGGTAALGALEASTSGGDAEGPLAYDETRFDASTVEEIFDGFVRFGVPPQAQGAEGEEAAPPPPVDVDIYIEQLSFVRDALQAYLDDPTANGDKLVDRIQTAQVRVRAQIEAQDVPWRPRFEALLWPPIEGMTASTSSSEASGLSRRWCNDVVSVWDGTLVHRYPMVPDARQDAKLSDFANFFRPGDGILWSFYADALARILPQEGKSFGFVRRLGRDLAESYNPSLPAYLGGAARVSEAFFPPGSKVPLVEFDVQIIPSPGVEKIEFVLGDQKIAHENGPERWHRMQWPTKADDHGAKVIAMGDGVNELIQQEGDFGLFRLMEQGSIVASSGDGMFVVKWVLHDQDDMSIMLKFRTSRAVAPFFGDADGKRRNRPFGELRNPDVVRIPRGLARGDVRCPEPANPYGRPSRKKRRKK